MDKSDSIKVVVRIRGLIQREADQGCVEVWAKEGDDSVVKAQSNESWIFNKVYGMEQPTVEIFDDLINPIMEDVMKGINGTAFAYGQTSSGKTYTMMGNEDSPGIIHMCINSIFNRIENTPDREFMVLASYMEIYNENVVDLLMDSRKQLNLGETLDGEVFVRELLEKSVKNGAECLECLKKGEKARHYGQTNMNERSSRSHVIFRMVIESKLRDVEDDASFIVSQLNLIDLAGSEKLKQTGSTGQRMVEGAHINKSLLTLSQVINQLMSNASHISYRDSKLTRILQNSLGGNSKTAFICAVTPVAFEETLSTLRFATNVKKIKNKPIINELVPDSAQLLRVVKEKDKLVKELDELKKQNIEVNLKVHDYICKINRLESKIIVSSQPKESPKELSKKRRETWCPGKTMSAINFQPNILEECEDDFIDDSNIGIPRRSCGLIRAPVKEPPATKSDDIEFLQQQHDFERDVLEQQVQRLTEKIEAMQKQAERSARDVLSVARDQMTDELEKKFELFYLRDEERVYSMPSPIKLMQENEDKTMQTSILECEVVTRDVETTEIMMQTSFAAEDNDKVRVVSNEMTQSSKRMIQTSFYENENDDNPKKETDDKMIETSFLEHVEKHEVTTQTCPFNDKRETSLNESMDQAVLKSPFVENKPFSLADELAEVGNKMYKEKLNDYEDKIVDYETKIDDYEEKIVDYKTKVTNFVNKISDYEGKMNELEERIRNYENQISEFKVVDQEGKRQESEDRLAVGAERLKCLEDELESTRATISSLSTALLSKDFEIEQFKTQIKETASNLDNISELFSNSKSQMDNLATEIRSLNLQNKELKNLNLIAAEEFKKLIDGLNEQLADALMAKNEFKSRLESQDQDTETVSALKNQIELMLVDHKEKMDSMETEKATAAEQFKQKLESLEKELSQENSRQEEFEREKEHHESEIDVLRKQCQLLKEFQVAEKDDEGVAILKDKYEEDVKRLSDRIESLKDQLDECNKRLFANNSESNLKLEILENDHKAKIRSLQDEHEKEIEYINKKYTQVFEEMKKTGGEVEPEEIQRLNDRLDEARSKLEESQFKSLSLETELNNKIAELTEAYGEFKECEETLAKCKTDHDNEVAIISKENIVLQEEIENLKRDDEKLKDEYMKVLKTIEQMHKDELENMKNDHAVFVEDLKSQHEEEIGQKLLVAREKLDSELDKIRKSCDEEFELIKKSNKEMLENIEKEQEVVLEELNLRNAREMEKKLGIEKECFDLELSDLKKSHRVEIEDMERQNTEEISSLKNDLEIKMEQFKNEYTKQCMDQFQNNEVGIQKTINELAGKVEEYNKLYLKTLEDVNERSSEISDLKSEIDRIVTSKIVESEHLNKIHKENMESLKQLHNKSLEDVTNDRNHLLQKVQDLLDDAAGKEEEHEQEINNLNKYNSSEMERMQKEQMLACEKLESTHSERIEELNSKVENLEYLKAYTKNQHLDLLDSFQIDISSNFFGKVTTEDRINHLFSCLKEFIECKLNQIQQLEEELGAANQNLMNLTEKSSHLSVERAQRVQEEKVALMEKQAQLSSELDACMSNMMRYRDDRDKAIISLRSKKKDLEECNNQIRMMNIRIDTLKNGQVQSDKREAALMQRLDRQKLEMQGVSQLKAGLVNKDKELDSLKAEYENLKTKYMEKDLELAKQDRNLLELKEQLLHKSQASVASKPANRIDPFNRVPPADLEPTTAYLYPQLVTDLSRVEYERDVLEARNIELEKKVSERDIDNKTLRLKLRSCLKKLSEKEKGNQENAEVHDIETRALQARNMDAI